LAHIGRQDHPRGEELTLSDDELNHGISRTVNTRPRSGETRDCLDPWYQPFIQPTGDVWPCCWFFEKLGNVNETAFDQIISSDAFKDLRRELLTGQLRKQCIQCPSRSITTPDKLLARLRATKLPPQASSYPGFEETPQGKEAPQGIEASLAMEASQDEESSLGIESCVEPVSHDGSDILLPADCGPWNRSRNFLRRLFEALRRRKRFRLHALFNAELEERHQTRDAE
jgi:radical SAM protein with 4Fe4S-binding SPASM domain